MANRSKLTIDFKDRTDLVDALRLLAARDGISQREIVADALQAYFSHRQENSLLLDAANHPLKPSPAAIEALENGHIAYLGQSRQLGACRCLAQAAAIGQMDQHHA